MEATTVSVWGNLRKGALGAGASLLLCFASTVLAQQNSPQPRTSPTTGPVGEAQLALSQGKPELAVDILSRHLAAHSDDISARIALAEIYLAASQNDRAEDEFDAALKHDPNNPAALAGMGGLLIRTGRFEMAEAMLAGAAKNAHSSPQIRTEWAIALARLHRYKEAQNALAGLSPPSNAKDAIVFHRLKASVTLGLGNTRGAASEMEMALALNSQDVELTMATAVAELQCQNWQRVVSLAQPVFSRTRDAQFGLVLLQAQLAMHANYQQTLDMLRGIQLAPDAQMAFRQRLAEMLISHREFSASVEDLKKAAELEPNRANLLFDLALAEYRAGAMDDALATAQKCKALDDTAGVEDLLGDIQESLGDNLSAVRSYQSSIKLAPNDQKYRLALAVEFIRHSNFDASRVVLKQAEELWPSSWRVQLALGIVEYFAGSGEQAMRILLHAAELAPEPETALQYVGNIEIDEAAPPSPAVIAQLCGYSERHPDNGKMQFYCGALLFRRDYVSGDKAHSQEIIQRLHVAANILPHDASPHCQLGRVYRWVEHWPEALRESQACVRMDPNAADGHYRLAQIYQRLGQHEPFKREMKLYEAASKRVEDENAHRDQTMKTFLYAIQAELPDRK
jgi:tetratricopeptide (TPR) repeat protein